MCLLGPPAVLLLHLCDERADVLVLLRIAEVPVVHLDAFQRVVLDRHQVKEDVVSRSVRVRHSDPPFLKACTETNRPRPSEVPTCVGRLALHCGSQRIPIGATTLKIQASAWDL